MKNTDASLTQKITQKMISRYGSSVSSSDATKSTDINILLNRVRINKKKEFKIKIIFSISLLLTTIMLGFFLLS